MLQLLEQKDERFCIVLRKVSLTVIASASCRLVIIVAEVFYKLQAVKRSEV